MLAALNDLVLVAARLVGLVLPCSLDCSGDLHIVCRDRGYAVSGFVLGMNALLQSLVRVRMSLQ